MTVGDQYFSAQAVIAETMASTNSERQARAIDHDQASMEKKKQEGYF